MTKKQLQIQEMQNEMNYLKSIPMMERTEAMENRFYELIEQWEQLTGECLL